MKKFSNVFSSVFFIVAMIASSYVSAAEMPPAQGCCMQYGSFYTKDEMVVAPEHAILFNKELLCPTKGIEHPQGSGEFILKEAGVYRITYSVSLKENKSDDDKDACYRKVALTLNGHVVRGSEMFVGESDHLSTMTLLVKVCGKSCCDHVLRIVNNNPLSDGWHNISLEAGCSCDSVSAAITIEKVCPCPSDCCCKSSQD
jgi:hypothetical protein